MALENVSELSQVLAERQRLGLVFARHAYGMRAWVDLFSERVPAVADPEAKALLAQLVADNARHMLLFRERALANGVDPDAYVPPPEGEAIYERIPELDGARRAGRLRARLARPLHRAARRLPRRGRRRGPRDDRRGRGRRRADAGRPGPADRGRRRAAGRRGPRALPPARAGRDAALRACRLRPRCRASPTCSASCRRSHRAPGASRRCAPASRAGALLSDGLRIGYRHGFDSGPFMAHVYANRPSGRTAVGRAIDRRLLGRRTCVAFRDIRALAERAVFDALRAERGPAPVVADLAAGPAPYLLSALTAPHARPRDPGRHRPRRARRRPSRRRGARRRRSRAVRAGRRVRPRRARRGCAPRPTSCVELGLYGIYHDDALIERHFQDLAELVVAEPDRLQRADAQPRDRAHRARVGQPRGRALRLAAAAGRADPRAGRATPATSRRRVEADRFDIYRVVRLVREDEAA